MRIERIVCGAIVCLYWIVIPGTGATEAMETAGRLIGGYAEAFNSGDPAAVAALYAEDVRYTDERGRCDRGAGCG